VVADAHYILRNCNALDQHLPHPHISTCSDCLPCYNHVRIAVVAVSPFYGFDGFNIDVVGAAGMYIRRLFRLEKGAGGRGCFVCVAFRCYVSVVFHHLNETDVVCRLIHFALFIRAIKDLQHQKRALVDGVHLRDVTAAEA